MNGRIKKVLLSSLVLAMGLILVKGDALAQKFFPIGRSNICQDVAKCPDIAKILNSGGVPGPRGPAGPAGAVGPTGPIGPAGPASCQGTNCLTNNIYFVASDEITMQCAEFDLRGMGIGIYCSQQLLRSLPVLPPKTGELETSKMIV